MIFVVSLPMSRSSLFVQQSPSAPYWRSCTVEEMKSAMIDVSYAASQTQILKSIHSKAIVSRLDLSLTAMRTMTSYAAADCHFQQDAHRRMASVIARIRSAQERESPPPDGTKIDKGDTATRKRRRGFAPRI